RAGNFAAPCRVGAGKNRVGSVPGGSQTTWADRVESGFSLCAWSGSRTAGRLPAAFWCLPPEPAKHPDGPCDARHVRARLAAHSAVPLQIGTPKRRPEPAGDSHDTVGVRLHGDGGSSGHNTNTRAFAVLL